MNKFFEEFKTFAMRGNVVDMAVGVVIGSAFGAITTSIVNDIFMPLIGCITGGIDFSTLAITVGNASINYGNFIQTVINFILVAFCMFLVVKAMNATKKKTPEAPKKVPRLCPYCRSEIADDATRCPHCTSELK